MTQVLSKNKISLRKIIDMIYRKIVLLVSLWAALVNIVSAGVCDLDTLNVVSQSSVEERMPVVPYTFNPKSLILPASLITVGALAEGMNGLMVHGLKNWVNEPRPDGMPYSFPSGHTSNAFLGAHMAYKEF